ncbi:hypothetical protein E8E12_003983 [Didymella heteroderae]|uniref:Ubiquitin-like protease family profile domain-containing protein n=1 Tax=Didymella heteroderae TaxID=1769908 RepID=A0A9P5C055_9PLEO|nr:hypothetical protein E8E12_003983 [Didymella heteroderae]
MAEPFTLGSNHVTGNTKSNKKLHPTNKDEWLSSTYIHADWPMSMTVEEFSKVKAASDAGDSFWQDSHINWALEFIRRRHERLEDVTIVEPHNCGILYLAGIDPSSIPDKNSTIERERRQYELDYAPMAEQLRATNIIILPVNNGFKTYHANAAAATEGLAESDKPQNQSGYRQGAGVGAHWSFIVVDRHDPENPTARYVDGQVFPRKRRNGKWTITNIDTNGEVAGKILRGFDNLLELEQGKFAASTLKFVPHMQKANASGGSDYGPCGPYLYAFLDHILANKTNLIDPGLQAAYNDESTSRSRAKELGFDSLAVRARFAEELLEERKKYEAQHRDRAVANLTDEVLRCLMTVDGLISLVRPTASSSELGTSGNWQLGGNHGGPGDNDDDGDGDEDGFFGDPPVQKALLREEINDHPGAYADIVGRNARYEIAYTALVQRQKQKDAESGENSSAKTEPEPKAQRPNTIELYLGKHRYRNVPLDNARIWPEPEVTANIKFPAKFKRVPDFTVVLPDTLKRWVNNDPEIKARVPNFKDVNWDVAPRAFLHVKINKTLLDQNDNSFQRLWCKDRAVFNPQDKRYTNLTNEFEEKEDKSPMYGIMREMYMRHYMGNEMVDELFKILEEYKVKEPAPSNKRKRNDEDDDNHSGDDDSDKGDPDNSSGKNKRVRRGRGDADKGDKFHQGYHAEPPTNGSGGSANRHAALQDLSAFQTIANQAIDFVSMSKYHVGEWIHRVASHGILTSSTGLDHWERRVRLQRAFGGIFTENTVNKETAAYYRGHLKLADSLSFAQIIKELNRLTENVPNLRGQIQWYPDYYLQEHGVIPADAGNQNSSPPTGNGAAANPEPTSKPGSTTTPGSKNSAGGEKDGGKDPIPVTGNKCSNLHDISLTTPGPQQLINFRIEDTVVVRRHMTREMRDDPRFRSVKLRGDPVEPNDVSRRAMCFVDIAGKRFGDESDAHLEETWYDDPLVFTEIQRRSRRLKGRMIRKKMAKHYHPLEPLEHDHGPDEEDETEEDTEEDEPELWKIQQSESGQDVIGHAQIPEGAPEDGDPNGYFPDEFGGGGEAGWDDALFSRDEVTPIIN